MGKKNKYIEELTDKEIKKFWNDISGCSIETKTISISEAIERFEDNLTIEEIRKLKNEEKKISDTR